jgi:Ca2+-transporting ATPase
MDAPNCTLPEPRSPDAIHQLSPAQAYASLGSRSDGLTQIEAEARALQYGPNVIRKVKGVPLWRRFLSNFTHTMAILLWAGGLVAFVAQMPQLGIAIWAVNIINGVFSFSQEFKAEQATEALQRLLSHYARIRRDGVEQRILAEELVPGDVVLLAEGDRVPADGRLVQQAEMQVDQSTLTGESRPVRKTEDAVLGTGLGYTEMPNMVFASTSVAAGTGLAVVTSIGMDTVFGKIASLTQSLGNELSPLQREMARITRIVTIMATSIGAVFFVLGILIAGVDLAESFIFALGMIVAFVPEGMLPTVTLSLAMGVQRMAKRGALVKKLSAVETLGCTTVICTDKTGTLTQNEMTVRNLWVGGRQLTVTGSGYEPHGEILLGGRALRRADDDLRLLVTAGTLCNNARLVPPAEEGMRWTVLGDPTEAALVVLGTKAEIDPATLQSIPRLRELPFDSRRKRMSTIHPAEDTTGGPAACYQTAYVKGAPREIAALCTRIRWDGVERPLDDALRARIVAANDEYARGGLRVLAMAMRSLPEAAAITDGSSQYTSESIEQDLTFLGLAAMMDPPRLSVARAVELCHRAGIRIIMITGDYGLTAESIALRIGILPAGSTHRVITGSDLDGMSEEALKEALVGDVVFARVAPEHKLRVVTALQALGHIVAVTGDGVNDAPALKKADIGVAMGLAGTDVAKEAADMILTDDDFGTIVNAVEEGRTVYQNIRRFATYVFNSNLPEAVPFVLMLFSRGAIPLPLTVMQILAIDLGTDMVPAIALGAEPPEAGTMDRPPRSQKEPLLNKQLLIKAFLWYGVLNSIGSMSAYFFANWLRGWPGVPLASGGMSYAVATTMTLAGVVACQIGIVFACRTDKASAFSVGLFSNRLVLVGIAAELLILGLISYVPFLHDLFGTGPLGWREWLFLMIWPPIMLFADELRKAILRRHEAKSVVQPLSVGGEA